MRVIARKGMAAATMQDIADEAGVAKGTIYLYFRDRDELLETTFQKSIHALHERIDASLDPEGSFEANFRASIRQIFEFFGENREFFRLYVAHRFPEGSAQQQRRQRRHCEIYQERITKCAAMLERAMERGEIRRMDPGRLAIFLTEGTNAIVVQRVTEEEPPRPEEDIDLIVGAMLDGIRSTS